MAEVPIAGPDGIVWVGEEKLTEAQLSMVGKHHNAIQAYLSGADPEGKALASMEGRSISLEGRSVEGQSLPDVPLITDLGRILELDENDLLTFEQFYEKRKQ
jgi:hypothetical protein